MKSNDQQTVTDVPILAACSNRISTSALRGAVILAFATIGVGCTSVNSMQAKNQVNFDDAGARCEKRSDCKSHTCLVSSATDSVGTCAGNAKQVGSYYMLDESKNVIQVSAKK